MTCVQLLLAGLQDIDVNDWKKNTKYRGEYNPNHPVIVNFWKVSVVRGMKLGKKNFLLSFSAINRNKSLRHMDCYVYG